MYLLLYSTEKLLLIVSPLRTDFQIERKKKEEKRERRRREEEEAERLRLEEEERERERKRKEKEKERRRREKEREREREEEMQRKKSRYQNDDEYVPPESSRGPKRATRKKPEVRAPPIVPFPGALHLDYLWGYYIILIFPAATCTETDATSRRGRCLEHPNGRTSAMPRTEVRSAVTAKLEVLLR